MANYPKFEFSPEKFQALPAKSRAYNLGDQVDNPQNIKRLMPLRAGSNLSLWRTYR